MPYTMPPEIAWCAATPYSKFPERKLLEGSLSFDEREGKSYTSIVVYMSPGSESEINLTTAFSSRKR
jgi:hypothetical protein